MQNKIVLIVPFFNESETIAEVCGKASEFVDLIIAVDDGSNDGGSLKIENLRKVKIVKHQNNRGKGAALKTGFGQALKEDAKIAITIDADLQHDVSFLPKFIEKIKEFDVVIGNRMRNIKRMPLHRKVSNFLTSGLISIKTGVRISDSQCGYRAFKTERLREILPQRNGFEAESEMIIKAAKLGLKFGYVDIPTIYGGDNSKMKNFSATIGFISVLLKRY